MDIQKKAPIFVSTYCYKVIYVFKINDEAHKGILKIGESTLTTKSNIVELKDNCEELNRSARKRIRGYTNTIGVQEELLYTTLAISAKNTTFKDSDVHKVLKNSGIKKHNFGNSKNPIEWYETNLQTVKNAILAVKEGRKCLNRTEVEEDFIEIEFRPEQIEAIEKTMKKFSFSDRMLWNAKMRFGKTLSTLEVIKRMSSHKKFNLSKAIILTHRPVVNASWFEDYTKIFHDNDEFLYGSKGTSTIKELQDSGKKFIYFASMQDLRESNAIGGRYNKNDAVFQIDWDFIVIDEAHEGTQTELGQMVIKELLKSDIKRPKQLYLSGTPFNLLSDFESNEIYTWDYLMEQKAKLEWEKYHPLQSNPYEELPRMNIYTYNLKDYLPEYQELVDKAFNFKEFFRVWTGEVEKDGIELKDQSHIGKFIHEKDVEKFLNLLTKQDSENQYPFSKQEYIENLHHTFWILPGVKEAKALKELMQKNEVFSQFDIVNVAGTGDETKEEALEAVEKAIGENPDDTYTITLSCGRLTAGVTVKPWSAVLYLAGSYSTSASSYLQTIFRVQSPCSFGGKQKTNCYVFDFAPDRTLKMIAEAGDLNTKAGSTSSRENMKQFLNFCPVISIADSEMKPYDVGSMLQQLKRFYIERVADNGFDDTKIYNDNLLKLDDIELSKFEELKGIIGSTQQKKKMLEIGINEQGFSEEQWDTLEEVQKIKKELLTEEQKQLLEELKEKKKQKQNAISILRGISIRIPLLIYGADINDNEDITIENFTDIVDDISWQEFMPKGITKFKFKEFSKYYDNEVFLGAGRRIRNIVKHADTLSPIERAKTIANLFSTFKNPDKETVLTPWRTVSRHMGETIGGYNFFDEQYKEMLEKSRFIDHGEITDAIFSNQNVKILELNSKTGLYPLYMTIGLYLQKCFNIKQEKLTDDFKWYLWHQIVAENIYIICKTPMAKTITKRTLLGYQEKKSNILNIENIVDDISSNFSLFENKIKNPATWEKEGERMEFDAIIGNPPYQNSTGGGQAQGTPLYDKFVLGAIKLRPKYVSMIMPARWYSGGFAVLDRFRPEFIKDNHISQLCDFPSALDCFSNVEIKGGVCYFLWDKNYHGKCEFRTYKNNELVSKMKRYLLEDGCQTIIRDNEAIEILKKIKRKKFDSFSKLIGPLWPYSVTSSFDTFSHKKKRDDDIFAYVMKDKGWISKSEIKKNMDIVNQWKLFIPRSVGKGHPLSDVIKPIKAGANTCCSGTYIICGPFKSEVECDNVMSYINTKFFHFLLSLKKISQDNTTKCYEFIPLVDFNQKYSDEILFKVFELTEEEIEYIRTTVRDDIGK